MISHEGTALFLLPPYVLEGIQQAEVLDGFFPENISHNLDALEFPACISVRVVYFVLWWIYGWHWWFGGLFWWCPSQPKFIEIFIAYRTRIFFPCFFAMYAICTAFFYHNNHLPFGLFLRPCALWILSRELKTYSA